MSLTGNLEVFPLQEVLRMLARANKTGCLRVEFAGNQGRIFLSGGALTMATTSSDDEFRRQILNAGLIVEDDLRKVDLTGDTLADVLAPGVSPSTLTDLVREHTVESLYRIRRPGNGSFDFVVDLTPRYATGQSFDAEVAVSEADRRATEWADIETVIADMHAPLAMARSLPDENNVTITPATWRVLASLESGLSVSQLANTLGLSLFRAAREMSGLVRNKLVEVRSGVAFTPQAPEAEPEAAPEWEAVEEAEQPAPIEEEAADRWVAETESEEASGDRPTTEESTEGSESWWQADDSERWEEDSWLGDDDESDESVEQNAGDRSEVSLDRTGGWWAQAMGDSGRQPEDPDAFLETVFSQLDEGSEQEEPEETGFSMGLLRRRRMGAPARDITEG